MKKIFIFLLAVLFVSGCTDDNRKPKTGLNINEHAYSLSLHLKE